MAGARCLKAQKKSSARGVWKGLQIAMYTSCVEQRARTGGVPVEADFAGMTPASDVWPSWEGKIVDKVWSP